MQADTLDYMQKSNKTVMSANNHNQKAFQSYLVENIKIDDCFEVDRKLSGYMVKEEVKASDRSSRHQTNQQKSYTDSKQTKKSRDDLGMPVKRLTLKERKHIDILSSDGTCDILSPHSSHAPFLEQSALYRNVLAKINDTKPQIQAHEQAISPTSQKTKKQTKRD